MIENFSDQIKNGLVLLDFYASWCGPCKMMHPIIDEIINEYSELKVIKIDVDKNEDIARNYAIMSIPTLILLKDGNIVENDIIENVIVENIVEKNIGFTPKDKLDNWINQHK